MSPVLISPLVCGCRSVRSPWGPFLYPPIKVQSGMGPCSSCSLASASLKRGDTWGAGRHAETLKGMMYRACLVS